MINNKAVNKTINKFKFTKKANIVRVKYEGYSRTFNNVDEAGNWVYNMADNNDIGNDTVKKLFTWYKWE
jgi:hypothetical protein